MVSMGEWKTWPEYPGVAIPVYLCKHGRPHPSGVRVNKIEVQGGIAGCVFRPDPSLAFFLYKL